MKPEAAIQRAEEAAQILAGLRRMGRGRPPPLEDLPLACRPESLAEAYAIQEALAARLAMKDLGPAVGFKIGCTTPVMQAYLQIDHPCAGRLYRNSLYAETAQLKASDYHRLGLECEIAVRLGADIDGARVVASQAELASEVVGVMASVEIVEHRFADFSTVATPSLVADDFFSAGCVLGPARPPAELGDLAGLKGGFAIDGAAPEIIAKGAAILGHPLNALAWLADHQAARGEPLKAGQVITLGSVVKTLYPEPGMTLEARFDGLAPVRVTVV